MTHPSYMKTSLEGPIPGCNRLQICGWFALFCLDLQSYLVDLVDVVVSPVQFETRHLPDTDVSEFFPSLSLIEDKLRQMALGLPTISPTFPQARHPNYLVAASCFQP